MWFVSGSELSVAFNGLTDFHSHILPGVDDGVRDLGTSLKILEEYERMGVRELYLTPHVMEDTPNTTAFLKDRFGELRDCWTGNISLHLASENMMDNLFDDRLTAGDFLLLEPDSGGKIPEASILLETSYFNPPFALYERLQSLLSKGYWPIIAHPERYLYMKKEDYARLKDMGARFQLNLFSLVGMYGRDALKRAEYLLKKGWYDITGTDIHGLRQLENGRTLKVRDSILKLLPK